MTLTIRFSKSPPKPAGAIIGFVLKDKALTPGLAALDKKSASFIADVLERSETWKGKKGEMLVTPLPKTTGYTHAVLVSLGDQDSLSALDFEEIGGRVFKAVESTGAKSLSVFFDFKSLKAENAAYFASGMMLRSYKFDVYRKSPKTKPVKNTDAAFILNDHAAAAKIFKRLEGLARGVMSARNFVNEPPNVLYPESFAKAIKAQLTPLGVEVEILDDRKIAQLGMGAITAVGQGSDRKPRMVVLRWPGANKAAQSKPLALVGKGVTFDSGGISIKPGLGMEDMKMDMGGAAAVVGTMEALARRASKAHVVGLVGLAENMPSSNAYRPADILKSYAGKTIEVLNTDAEGRLVLCDVLTYAQKKYKPHTIIDLATLTGAIIVALGYEYCGAFVNDDPLWQKLQEASAQTGEKLWRMPLDPLWRQEMESTLADLQNMAKTRGAAGSCVAAGFLEHFIDEGVKWAHLDIAGTAWIKSDRPLVPKNATGFGVRLLSALIENHYE